MRHPEDGAVPEIERGRGRGGAGDHLDEGTIHAWLDDALSPAEVERLLSHLEGCAECRAAVAEARGLVAASRRILQALDDGPGGVHAAPVEWPRQGGGDPGDPASDGSAQRAGGTGLAASAGPEQVRWGRTPAPARRRWRVPAVAAVAVLAVGTAVVVQRSGAPAPLTGERPAIVESPRPAPPVAADELREPAPTIAAAPAAPQATIGAEATTAAGRAMVARGTGEVAPLADAEGERGGAAVPEAELRKAPPIVRPPAEVAGAVASATEVAPTQPLEPAAAPAPAPAAAAPTSALVAPQGGGAPGVVPAPQPQLALRGAAAAPVRSVGPVVAGRVSGNDGEPVAEAQVTIPDAGRGATTDVTGRFRLAGLPAGEHGVLVRKIGFQPVRLTLRVSVTGDSVVAVTLVPIPAGGDGAVGAELRRDLPTPVPVAVPPVLPGSLSVVMRRLAGCYRLELGGAASEGRDLAEGALPGWVHLRATPSDRVGWLAADPLLSSPSQQPGGHARWRTGGGGDVEIVWPMGDAATEVVLHLRGTGEVLTGTAALRRTGNTPVDPDEEEEVASVVFVRSVCSQ